MYESVCDCNRWIPLQKLLLVTTVLYVEFKFLLRLSSAPQCSIGGWEQLLKPPVHLNSSIHSFKGIGFTSQEHRARFTKALRKDKVKILC